jgi:hypothetical protein
MAGPKPTMNPCEYEREDLEINLLLEAIHGYYGFDFPDYSRALSGAS